MTARLPLALVGIAVASAAPAHADNCVDDCRDVGSSFGGAAFLRAPGFVEVDAQVFRIGLFDPHGRGRGFSMETFDFAAIDDDVDVDGDWDLDHVAWSGLGARFQIDHADWGAYVQGHLVGRWFGDMRYVIPSVGLRVGPFDRAAVITEARFAGLAAGGMDASKLSATRDLDLALRATLVVRPWLRLEARARYRDLVTSGDHHIRDVVAAVGLEVAVAAKHDFRVMPLFIGAGVRRSLLATAPAPVELESTELPGGVRDATQLLVWLELDFAINSSRAVW